MKNCILLILLSVCVYSCNELKIKDATLFDPKDFAKVIDEKKTSLYTLDSGNGIQMQVTNLGGQIVSVWTPDKKGNYEDIVGGYRNIEQYILNNNKNQNYLHDTEGENFRNVVWDIEKISRNEIILTYTLPDTNDYSNNNIFLKTTYLLTPQNELKISQTSISELDVNFPHTIFFNLKGETSETIADHILAIYASYIIPENKSSLKPNKLMSVKNSPYDFRNPTTIENKINSENKQLAIDAGFYSWFFKKDTPNELIQVAMLYEPVSGRKIDIWSDQSRVQFFSGFYFDDAIDGKNEKKHKNYESLGIKINNTKLNNNSNDVSSSIHKKITSMQTCIYKFSTK